MFFNLSRGTFETILKFWRNLDTKISAYLMILTEPCKELAEPVGSAEPRLKNTGLELYSNVSRNSTDVLDFPGKVTSLTYYKI